MKIKLIAASAALLACSAAQAQTSVTLYGVADIGLEYLTKVERTDDNLLRMSSGNLSGSRWGLRGSEDLGGGLKSVFVLESGFHVDTGAGGSRLFNRQAYLGLQGKFGTLTMGRHQNLLYDFTVDFDPLGAATRYSMSRMDADMVSRADNSIKYTGKFGGLSAAALYSFGYNNNGEVAGQWRRGREMSGGLGYAAGPFAVSAVYDHRNPTESSRVQRATVGGTYAVGPAKLYAGYRWAQLIEGKAGSRANLWWAGASYQATPALTLAGAAYYQDYRRVGADPWMFSVQADYAFSKRTDVYLSTAYAMNRKANGLTSGLSLDGELSPSLKPATPGKKQNQFGVVVGIRHRF